VREVSPASTIAKARSAAVCAQRARYVLVRRCWTIAPLDDGDLLSHLWAIFQAADACSLRADD
jgi:hypothetical protein